MRCVTSGSAVVLLIASLLAACAGGGGGLPVTHYYTLAGPASSGAAAGPEAGLVVGVRSLAVDPPYDQDRLVYREGPEATEIGFYAYHRWASPLGRLVAVALADGLSGTPGIASIEPARAATDYTARLDGRVIYLEEVDSPGAQEVRLSMELTLRDAEGGVVWSAVLTSAAAGRVREVSEVAAMAQRAFDDVVGQARAGIAAALEERATAAE